MPRSARCMEAVGTRIGASLRTPRAPRSPRPDLIAEDAALLEKLLHEPPEYIDHPDLHQPDAEVAIFGRKVKLRAGGVPRLVDALPLVDDQGLVSKRGVTLTAAQEIQLFLRYNYARMQAHQLATRGNARALSAAATLKLVAWGQRILETRALIVRINIPLVLAMAKRTRLSSIDFNELVSEGNMALLRSVEKFDCGRGFKFSTYSCRAILKSFSRVAMRASRYRGRFPVEFDPTIEKSDYLEKKRDVVEDDCVDELKSILLRNLADLSDVERTVINERFAIPGDGPSGAAAPKTLEQVGGIIGVTKERVRQIQNKALNKIRLALEEGYLAA